MLSRYRAVAGLLLFVGIAGACQHGDDQAGEGTSSTGPPAEAPIDAPGLHNVLVFDDGVYSGSMPEGDAGFDSLESMGIRTVISVDGARPDIERASLRGMRYVHIPIQYSGMEATDEAAVAKAIRDLPKPIYVHCHHGKHRGPAAAATGLILLNEIDSDRGIELLKLAGTSPSYPGLYACVSEAEQMDADSITIVGGDLPEHAVVSGLVASMAAIDRAWDHLKILSRTSWAAPSDHPDLVAAAEAGMIHDQLRSLMTDVETMARPTEYREMMAACAAAASSLEEALVLGDASGADSHFVTLRNSCKACHEVYRDDP